jgi:protein-L-isoaspartate(D-aspartate) O-methyltransferase
MTDFAARREEMVERQLKRRGIKDRRVLDAFREVPRELFVPAGLRDLAYEDGPLPIEAEQTISQPYIVAEMIEAAEVAPGEKVLEIGAGSGYAAALLGRIAAEVIAVERHAELVEPARRRMEALGCSNVRIVQGDGSGGLPEEAPFEAILVAASGSHVPDALRAQLAVGGILVMPLGEPDAVQKLVKVTRTSETEYRQEDLGPVRFVPLIGREAWRDKGAGAASLPELIRAAAEPLPDPDDSEAFGACFDRFAEARVVLLGEASHGTSEFYRARAAISRRLIERHGFDIVAVEADWPDAAAIDRYVRHKAAKSDAETAFRRFPTWMWRSRPTGPTRRPSTATSVIARGGTGRRKRSSASRRGCGATRRSTPSSAGCAGTTRGGATRRWPASTGSTSTISADRSAPSSTSSTRRTRTPRRWRESAIPAFRPGAATRLPTVAWR